MVAHAGLVTRTVGVQDAFGSARLIRITVELRQAGAEAVAALGVWTAWRRVARIIGNRTDGGRWRCWFTVRERIANVVGVACANWRVIDDGALGVLAA